MKFGFKNKGVIIAIMVLDLCLSVTVAAFADQSPLLNSDFAKEPILNKTLPDDAAINPGVAPEIVTKDTLKTQKTNTDKPMWWCDFEIKKKEKGSFLNPNYQDHESENPNLGDADTHIKLPEEFSFPIKIDLNQVQGLNLPSGIEMEAPIETVTYKDGAVYYGGQKLSSEDEAALDRLCVQSIPQPIPEQSGEEQAQ